MENSSSPSFRAEEASAVEVPAKDAAGVHDSNGTKIAELVDPIPLAKHGAIVDDQLPSLLSMVIDGLPPFQQSKYVHEAEKQLHKYVERYNNVSSLASYCRVGLSTASYLHPRVINIDRLVVISINYALQFLLDDIFFDTPDEFHQDQYGITRSVCGSPQNIQEYFEHLDGVFSQQVQPRNPASLIETMVWESGQSMLEMSNAKWFNHFVTSTVKHHRAGIVSHADIVQGHNSCFQDLESFTIMRAANVGGDIVQLATEFVNDTYIPDTLRASSYFENITTATSIHIGFVNDVFSYHKESSIEENPRNLITVMMECEGKPFVQTTHMAIDLVNSYAYVVMDLEAKIWNSTLRNYFQNIKALIAGNIYYSFMDKRYRHPDSVFPELRDMTSSWKILPHAKGSGF